MRDPLPRTVVMQRFTQRTMNARYKAMAELVVEHEMTIDAQRRELARLRELLRTKEP